MAPAAHPNTLARGRLYGTRRSGLMGPVACRPAKSQGGSVAVHGLIVGRVALCIGRRSKQYWLAGPNAPSVEGE
eukprot:9351371-Alexandrium_andersonii.AAC.1